VYLFTILPAPWFKRHRDNPQLKAFVDGATAAATGASTGAVLALGARAIVDLPTAIIGLVSLVILWRFKLSEPVLVIISGVVGLLLWPLLARRQTLLPSPVVPEFRPSSLAKFFVLLYIAADHSTVAT
jgi:chromate transporter